MSSNMNISVLALGLMGVLGSGLALAQTAPAAPGAAPAPATPAPTAPEAAEAAPAPAPQAPETAAAPQIPAILRGDAFSNVEARAGRRGGVFIEGTLTETGKDFDAIVNSEGNLIGIRTAEGSALPQALVDAILPEAARSNPILSEITLLNAIGNRDGAVMIGGQDASGDSVRMAFDADGELVMFGRGEHGKREMGDKGFGHGDRGDRGPREREHRGERREGGRHGGDHPAAPKVDEAAVRSAVEAAGYTALGDIDASRRGIAVEALNPQGEEVLVIVTPTGEVVRETAR